MLHIHLTISAALLETTTMKHILLILTISILSSSIYWSGCKKDDTNPLQSSTQKSGDVIGRAGNYFVSVSGDSVSWFPSEGMEEFIIHPGNQIGIDLGDIDSLRIWQLHVPPNATLGIPTPIRVGFVPAWVTQTVPPAGTQLQPLQSGHVYTITVLAMNLRGVGKLVFVR